MKMTPEIPLCIHQLGSGYQKSMLKMGFREKIIKKENIITKNAADLRIIFSYPSNHSAKVIKPMVHDLDT